MAAEFPCTDHVTHASAGVSVGHKITDSPCEFDVPDHYATLIEFRLTMEVTAPLLNTHLQPETSVHMNGCLITC